MPLYNFTIERHFLAQGVPSKALEGGRVEGHGLTLRSFMWFLYIVQCEDKSLYTGITTNIVRRLKEHNAGKGGGCTKARRPVALVYEEKYATRAEALKREAQIKRWSKQKKLALINGDKSLLIRLSKSRD